jgi:tRNA (cmo5U34)-methyltransferase
MTTPPADFFTEKLAKQYDERNGRLAPISDSLHFLMRLILEDRPTDSKVLSVGAGTGADILALADAFPGWSFVAVDPSLSMLNVCRERMKSAGLLDRCEFVHGFAHDLPVEREFDLAAALLVGHFVKHQDRPSFYRGIVDRLRVGGCFLNAEISFDLGSETYPSMLRNWQAVQRLMGATDESLKAVPQQLREVLTVLSPDEVDAMLVDSGIGTPVKFFQAFMISAWYGVKTRP